MPFKYSAVWFCVINNFLFRKLWTSYSAGPSWTSRVSPDIFFGIGKSTKMTNDVISDQPRSAKKIPETDHMASRKTPPWTKTMYFSHWNSGFSIAMWSLSVFLMRRVQLPNKWQKVDGPTTHRVEATETKCRDFIMFSEVTKKNNLHLSKSSAKIPLTTSSEKKRPNPPAPFS